MKKTKRIVIITGASSGFGLCMVKLFLSNGDIVYGLSNANFSYTDEEGREMIHYTCDISDSKICKDIITEIGGKHGQIDILINNAGIGISGAVENTSVESAKKIFDVNFFGAFYITKYALPYLRKRGGKIINTSSIASVVPLPFQSFYSSSKSAMDTLFSALREELYDYKISITALMPGDAKTNFTQNRYKNEDINSPYQNVAQKSVKQMEKDENNGILPEKVALAAFKIANKRKPPYTKCVGAKDTFLYFLSKILPKRLRSFIIRKIYASK